jgi:serine protease Do
VRPFYFIVIVNGGVKVYHLAEQKCTTYSLYSQDHPGCQVPILLRENKQKSIAVVLGERPESRPATAGSVSEPVPATKLGIEVQDLTDDLAQRFGYKGQSGVIVSQVASGSVAAENGITPGTLIVEVNRQAVANTRDFQNKINEAAKEENVLLLVNMHGHSRYVVLNIPKN